MNLHNILNEVRIKSVKSSGKIISEKPFKSSATNIKLIGVEVEHYIPHPMNNFEDIKEKVIDQYLEREFVDWLHSLNGIASKLPSNMRRDLENYLEEEDDDDEEEALASFIDDNQSELERVFRNSFLDAFENDIAHDIREMIAYEMEDSNVDDYIFDSKEFRELRDLEWESTLDGSLYYDEKNQSAGVEVVSPPFRPTISEVRTHIKALHKYLKNIKATFSSKTGIHVHVSFNKNLNDLQILNILKNIDEDQIYKMYGNSNRETYAPSVKKYVETMEKKLLAVKEKIKIPTGRYLQRVSGIEVKTDKYSGVYTKTTHGTMEFRYASFYLLEGNLSNMMKNLISWINYINRSVSEALLTDTYVTKSGVTFSYDEKAKTFRKIGYKTGNDDRYKKALDIASKRAKGLDLIYLKLRNNIKITPKIAFDSIKNYIKLIGLSRIDIDDFYEFVNHTVFSTIFRNNLWSQDDHTKFISLFLEDSYMYNVMVKYYHIFKIISKTFTISKNNGVNKLSTMQLAKLLTIYCQDYIRTVNVPTDVILHTNSAKKIIAYVYMIKRTTSSGVSVSARHLAGDLFTDLQEKEKVRILSNKSSAAPSLQELYKIYMNIELKKI